MVGGGEFEFTEERFSMKKDLEDWKIIIWFLPNIFYTQPRPLQKGYDTISSWTQQELYLVSRSEGQVIFHIDCTCMACNFTQLEPCKLAFRVMIFYWALSPNLVALLRIQVLDKNSYWRKQLTSQSFLDNHWPGIQLTWTLTYWFYSNNQCILSVA